MSAGAFKRIKAFFLKKFKPGSRKGKGKGKGKGTDTTNEEDPQGGRLPECPTTPPVTAAQRPFKPDNLLPESPSTPSIPEIRSAVKFRNSLSAPPRRRFPPIERPPTLKSTESSTTAVSSADTTTTATSVDVPKTVAVVSPPTSPDPKVGHTDDASVRRPTRPNALYPRPKSSHTVGPASWSELVEPDLVANLGARERARQQALFELVFSEEKYVRDLARMKKTLINPLLHPAPPTPTSPRPSPPPLGASQRNFKILGNRMYDPDRKEWAETDQDIDDLIDDIRLLGPFTKGTSRVYDTSMFGEAPKNPTPEPVPSRPAVPPFKLPEDLRICLEVIGGDILEGHVQFSKALKKRYEEQLPLVRSLENVLVCYSHVLTGYTKYILHLEKAVEQVDKAANGEEPGQTGGHKLLDVGVHIRRLEKNAAEKGETGLVDSLWKPFHRLFKYRLMFQNLLRDTCLELCEYGGAMEMMIAEVEAVIGGVGGEGIQKVERDMTRDVLERIDGLHLEKRLTLPKLSRVLIEERVVVRGIPRGSGKTWFVVFNDVVLRCQQTGTTSLPGWGTYGLRINPTPEIPGAAALATTKRGKSMAKQRNLYKFLKVETWDVDDFLERFPPSIVDDSRENVPATDEVQSSRAPPRIMPLPDNDESEDGDGSDGSDDSDRKTRVTSSTWGGDKITFQKPVTVRPRQVVPNWLGSRRTTGITTYNRDSSTDAKFGTRLSSSAAVAVPPHVGTRRWSPESTQSRPSWKKDPSANLLSRREDSDVGLYRQVLAEDDAIRSTESTVAPPRPSLRRVRAMGNNSFSRTLSSSPAGAYRQMSARHTILPPEPIAVPPLEVDEENKSPETPSIQGDPEGNTEGQFTDRKQVEAHIERTVDLTIPDPLQEQSQVEEVVKDAWRMSIQSDDCPMPGSFFCKSYIAQDDGG